MSNRQAIIDAIQTLSEIEFGYTGFRRVYWPYILGETRSGELEVFGWQRLSGKGGQPEFRQFRLGGLTGLVGTGQHFARPSEPVDLARRGFVRVIARV